MKVCLTGEVPDEVGEEEEEFIIDGRERSEVDKFVDAVEYVESSSETDLRRVVEGRAIFFKFALKPLAIALRVSLRGAKSEERRAKSEERSEELE